MIKEVIVPADDLMCIGKDKLQEMIRCEDCRYFGERMASGFWTCGRPEGCVKTFPWGFCGWGIKMTQKEGNEND